MGTSAPVTWSVVITVKVLALAKSRLADLADPDREALALAMAADTIAAAVACRAVGALVVVSDDPDVKAEAEALGAEVIADTPAAGLNQALVAGAAHAAGRPHGRGVAALTADLPALSPAELEVALTAAPDSVQAFVPDAAGTGTTLYAAPRGMAFTPRFGPRSRERHLRAGALELDLPGLAGLRRDVDTLDDLRSAAVIGLGRRSAAVTSSLAVADDPLEG